MNKARYVVTGGFGALGRAIGDALLASGAQAALVDRAPAAAGLPAGALACGGADLCDPHAARRCIDGVAERFGGLDGIVNVAGGFARESVEHGDIATWDRMYAMNVRTTLLASQAALPHLLRQDAAASSISAPWPPAAPRPAWAPTPPPNPAWPA